MAVDGHTGGGDGQVAHQPSRPGSGVDRPRRVNGRGVVLCVVGLLLPVALFLLLAKGVAEGVVRDLDEGVLRSVEAVHGEVPTALMRAVTFVGAGWGMAVLLSAVVLVLVLVCRPRRLGDAAFMVAVMAGAGLLQLLTKLLFERPRPEVFEPLVEVMTYSYPSGHALSSAAFALSLAVVCRRTRWWTWTVAGGAVFTLLVSFSRVYLGVHYPSDIVAGWLLAVAWTTAVWLVFEAFGRRPGGKGAEVMRGV